MEKSKNLFIFFLLMICINLPVVFISDLRKDLVFIITWFFSLPFMITSVVEINSSDQLNREEKLNWTFGFIVMPVVAGAIYFIKTRKRLLRN